MIYIFLMSIIPTFPAAFLTASDGVMYSSYDHDPRLWIRTWSTTSSSPVW